MVGQLVPRRTAAGAGRSQRSRAVPGKFEYLMMNLNDKRGFRSTRLLVATLDDDPARAHALRPLLSHLPRLRKLIRKLGGRALARGIAPTCASAVEAEAEAVAELRVPSRHLEEWVSE